ncbi:unnamed protein product, partial [Thlaspi arvense]
FVTTMLRRPIPIEEMVATFKRNHKESHLFKIDNFSLLTKYKIERLESSLFRLGGLKWKLIVYPKGSKNANGYVSIYLQNQDPIHHELEYQVYVVSQLEAKWHPNINVKRDFGTSSTPKAKGIHKLISLVDLERNGYLIEDCCMFGASLVGFEPGAQGTAECFSLIEKPLNHKVTWAMTKFSSFDPAMVHHSQEFVVGNKKWRIKVHERGFIGGHHKLFAVSLSGEGFINNAPKTKTFAKFKLRVFNQVEHNHLEKTESGWVDADDKHGFKAFTPLEKLAEPYLVNDKLYVGVDFEVISMTNYC